MSALSVGSTYDAITAEDLGSIIVETPPVREQRAIADFLDAETARIDALIAKKRRLIDLLRELAATLVWHRIGSLPRDGPRLCQVAQIHSGTGFPHAAQGEGSGDLPFLKVMDLRRSIDGRFVDTAENWVTNAAANALGVRSARPGSVVFPKVGAALLGNERRIAAREVAFDNNIMAVYSPSLASRFLHYYLSCIDLAEYANPGPVPSISESVIGSLRLPSCSRGVQELIADDLDRRIVRVRAPVAVAARQIALLVEHRQAVITAAVTGELDVAQGIAEEAS